MEDQPKWIAKSMTLWGAVITAVPVIAPLIGVDISPDDVATIGDSGVSIINAGFGIVGAVMVIYGRLRATTKATMLPKG
jgi:hypothetical protein